MGDEAPTWYASASGLFLDAPHLCLMEHDWHEAQCVASTRYFLLEVETAKVTRYAQSMQAYTEADYWRLLQEMGFDRITLYPSLTGGEVDAEPGLCAIMAKKGAPA